MTTDLQSIHLLKNEIKCSFVKRFPLEVVKQTPRSSLCKHSDWLKTLKASRCHKYVSVEFKSSEITSNHSLKCDADEYVKSMDFWTESGVILSPCSNHLQIPGMIVPFPPDCFTKKLLFVCVYAATSNISDSKIIKLNSIKFITLKSFTLKSSQVKVINRVAEPD